MTLVPRDADSLRDAALANEWLEARDDVTRLDADHFVVAIGSADISSQAEVWTARDGETLSSIVVQMATADHTYGSSLVLELRRLCEALAEDFDLVAVTPTGRSEVSELFESGAL